MTMLAIKRVPHKLLWLGIVFCTVYQSYRYPLQMNSAGTSPTYKDTPVIFQVIKYVAMLAICAPALWYVPRRKLAFRQWTTALLVGCVALYPLFKAITSEGGDRTGYVDISFWPLAALLLALATRSVNALAIDRFFRYVLWYALISDAVEVLLFVTIGRLPALAFEGSISVRFGGFLDDPNGFAALLYMLMGWVYFRYQGRRRLLLEFCLVLCVLVSQSLTAVGFLVILAGAFGVWRFFKRPRPVLAAVTSLVALATLAGLYFSFSGVIASISEDHSGSVQSHVDQVTDTGYHTAVDWLFGGTIYNPLESWWVGSLFNFGALWYALCVTLVALLSWRVLWKLREARSASDKAVMAGIFMLNCYFVFGCSNLPFFKIFPINFLFFLTAFLVTFDRLRLTGEEEDTTPADPVLSLPQIEKGLI